MSKPSDSSPQTAKPTALNSVQLVSEESKADETAVASPPAGDPKPAMMFAPPVEPGDIGTLGPYRVIRQVGAGAMGAVYFALDTRLNRRVALKVMLPEIAADPIAVERFLREGRSAAQISHDNVVTVFDADARDGVPFIAMQLLQGEPLDAVLSKGERPDIQQILRIARETTAGLAAAHALGLVHRDIKPANLWLEAPTGRVKVLDFGMAKQIGTDADLTRTGVPIGTPAYMSPEQARGQKVDLRTDLFSVGAVLYRLCTGKSPFNGAHVMAVLTALVVDDPTPVRELNPTIPESLAELIRQLLTKEPGGRPQSAGDVIARLDAITAELSLLRISKDLCRPVEPVLPPQLAGAPFPIPTPSAHFESQNDGAPSGSTKTMQLADMRQPEVDAPDRDEDCQQASQAAGITHGRISTLRYVCNLLGQSISRVRLAFALLRRFIWLSYCFFALAGLIWIITVLVVAATSKAFGFGMPSENLLRWIGLASAFPLSAVLVVRRCRRRP